MKAAKMENPTADSLGLWWGRKTAASTVGQKVDSKAVLKAVQKAAPMVVRLAGWRVDMLAEW